MEKNVTQLKIVYNVTNDLLTSGDANVIPLVEKKLDKFELLLNELALIAPDEIINKWTQRLGVLLKKFAALSARRENVKTNSTNKDHCITLPFEGGSDIAFMFRMSPSGIEISPTTSAKNEQFNANLDCNGILPGSIEQQPQVKSNANVERYEYSKRSQPIRKAAQISPVDDLYACNENEKPIVVEQNIPGKLVVVLDF